MTRTMKQDLVKAGWVRINPHVWKSPTGEMRLGSVAAWQQMKKEEKKYPIVATVGESVSWHLGADAEGNAVPVYHEDEATVKKFYENWNKPQK